VRYSIVLNRQLDVGVQLSALGRVAVGLAHLAPQPNQALRCYKDADGSFIGFISDHPLIVLGAGSSLELQQAYLSVMADGLTCNAFVLGMKDGEPLNQDISIQAKTYDELVFAALGVWSSPEAVRHVFSRFPPCR
jgi:uncharacterized protein DUF2000